MPTVNWLMTRTFDVLFLPFERGPGWLSLIVFSAVGGLCGLLVHKYTSNQAAIKRLKDRMKGHMLAIKLFRDDVGVMFRSTGDVLRCSLSLFRYTLVPLAIMMVPFVLATAQLGQRYQWRPVHPGESVVLSARMAPEIDLLTTSPSLETGDGVAVETPPLRIPSEHQVLWRVRAVTSGTHRVRVRVGQHTAEKTLTAGDHFERVSALRSNGGFGDSLIHPAEPPLPTDSAFQSISLAYPDRESWFCGTTVWMLWLGGVSIGAAFLLKPVVGVEF